MATTEFELVDELKRRGLTVSTAESCTGGMVAARITSISGASEVFQSGAVTYANIAKHKLLGVLQSTLDEHGAVSPETAGQMADGARALTGADIGVSVTGLAGPNGAEGKPVGLVFVGVASDRLSRVDELHFDGDRIAIREQAADHALAMALEAARA